MPYTLEYHPTGFVWLKYTGVVSPEEAKVSSIEGIQLAQAHGTCLYLADHFESVQVLPIEKAFDLMDRVDSETGVSRNSRLAIHLPAANESVRENLDTFATVASNQGWMVAIFDSCEQAVEWLFS